MERNILNKKLLAIMFILLLPLATLATVPSYIGFNERSEVLGASKSFSKNIPRTNSGSFISSNENRFSINTASQYSQVHINDSFLVSDVIIANESYVTIENSLLGNDTYQLRIALFDRATLVINHSKLENFVIRIYNSARLIIVDSNISDPTTPYIGIYGEGYLEIRHSLIWDTLLFIDSIGQSTIKIEDCFGDFSINSFNGYVNLRNVTINETASISIYKQSDLYISELFNGSASAQVSLSIYNSTATILNSSLLSEIELMQSSVINMKYSNATELLVGLSRDVSARWTEPEKSYGIITNSTITTMKINSTAISMIYNSTIQECYFVYVLNNTDVLIRGSIAEYDSYYEPLVLDDNSVIVNKIPDQYSFIILNSQLLVNESSVINNLFLINSAGKINDSSNVKYLYMYNSDAIVGNGSIISNFDLRHNSRLMYIAASVGFTLNAYDNSTILITWLSSTDMGDFRFWIYNSTLLINNSDFYNLGELSIHANSFSLVGINNTIIRNAPSMNTEISVEDSVLKIRNTTIYPEALVDFTVYESEIDIVNTTIYAPEGSDLSISLEDSVAQFNDSILNITIRSLDPIIITNGGETVSVGSNVTMSNVNETSLIVDAGRAIVWNSTLYIVESRGRVELYNSKIMERLLYGINVSNGDLYLSHGFYEGYGIYASFHADSNSEIAASDRNVIIYGLMAWNSNVFVRNVSIINMNITSSEVFIANATIGQEASDYLWDVGHAIFSYSNVSFKNVDMFNMDKIYMYKCNVLFNNSFIEASIYSYGTNLNVTNSYIDEFFTGLMLRENYGVLVLNDTGNIKVNSSRINFLGILSNGSHLIRASAIDTLVCAVSNVTVESNSNISTLLETYYWKNDGYVLDNVTHGYYLNVTAELDSTSIVEKKVFAIAVQDGYVWVNRSVVFVVISMGYGEVFVNSSKIVQEAFVFGHGFLYLYNVTIMNYDSVIMVLEEGSLEIDDSSAYNALISDHALFLAQNSTLASIMVNKDAYFQSNSSSFEDISAQGGVIDLMNSTLSYIAINGSELYIHNTSIGEAYLSYSQNVLINTSSIDFIMINQSIVHVYNTYSESGAYIDSGYLELVNFRTGDNAFILSVNGNVSARNITVKDIGILSEHLFSPSIFSGYDGSNEYANITVKESNVTRFYGAHFIVMRGGHVAFNNGTIIDETGIVKKLSHYSECNLVYEAATFYITDFALVDINGYNENNSKLISALIVMEFKDDVSPVVERVHDENITVEFGLDELYLNWIIEDAYPWYFELYFNESLVLKGNIELDQSVTINAMNYIEEPGLYIIELVAYDYAGNTGVNTTRLRILASEAPLITVTPGSIEFEIGMEPSNVTWTITDATPNYYELYLNDSLVEMDNYTSGSQVVFFTKNEINEPGVYNLTLVAYDGVGNSSNSTVIITAYPGEPPEITTYPTKDEYNITVGGYILLNWTASDRYPSTYQILINDTVVESGTWSNGQLITYNFTSTKAGTYIVKIVFNDQAGHSSIDSVTINVQEAQAPPPGPGPRPLGVTEIVIIVAISVASLIVIFLVIIPHIRRK